MEDGSNAAASKPSYKKGKRSNQARFPAARIKKMIQADEDVGKVATGTPIVVSKALELFLKALVDETVKDAQTRGSKKLTPYGLKRTIQNTALFDFCSDIVANVPDPIVNEGEGEDGTGKKKRAPRKKKPTTAGDEGAAAAATAPDTNATKSTTATKKRKASDDDEEDEYDEEDEEEGATGAPKFDDNDFEG
ncbi:hypothetical protein OIO90_004206 [Microbotryomycetes sp. JL221]|nr:hypothetical protein OIO90_004206 [Microbotryomycetes sp. JL221]